MKATKHFLFVAATLVLLLLATLTHVSYLAPFAAAQSRSAAMPSYAIRGAKIYTLAGAPIENGTLVIRDGKIAGVGAGVSVPAGAQTIEARGLEVYPGFFNAATQIGLNEVGAVAATVDTAELGDYKPQLIAMTAVNPESAHIPVTRVSGITHAITMPAGGVMSGQASVMYLAGWTVDELQLRRNAALILNWPSLQTGGFGGFGGGGGRGAAGRQFSEVKAEYDRRVQEISAWLDRTRHYMQASEKGKPANFTRDLKLEALVPVVKGEEPVFVIARVARDIRNAVEFCEKQHLRMILAEPNEAWKAKDLLKQKNIPVVLPPTLRLPEQEDESYDKPFTQPSELAAAGVKIAFGSFGNEFARRLAQQAGVAVGYGLPHEEAMKALTIYPAQMFGLEKQLGTLETGKTANVIVTNGDPLELKTDVKYLFINGRQVSLENRHKQLYDEWRKRY